MLHSHHHKHHHLLFSTLPVPLSLTIHNHPSLPSLHFLHRPITITSSTSTVSAIPPSAAWLPQLKVQQDLFSHLSSFLLTDDTSTIQLSSTLLLTTAFTLFFFRSVQRRAKRAKELKFRSSGVNKSLDNLKAMRSSSIKAKNPPSPDQALLGAVIAGVIAVVLYKFTTSVEVTLGRQTLSDNFSVRQITITIRTIINGLCYLATFVYGFNSLGLFLYSGQLAMDMVGGSSGKETKSKITQKPGLSNSSSVENNNNTTTTNNNNKLSSTKEDQSSDNSL